MPSGPPEEGERQKPDLPASLVPRWLALLVLCALLGAALLSVRAVLS